MTRRDDDHVNVDSRGATGGPAGRVFERQGYLDTRVADIVAEANVAQGVIDTMLTALHTDTRAEGPFVRVRDAIQRFVDAYRPNARIIALIEQVGSFYAGDADMRLALRAAFVDRSARSIRRLDPGPECPVTSAGRRDDHCEVVTASADGVATITLSNPARKNAMSIAGWAALRDALRAVAVGQDRVLVLTGAGAGSLRRCRRPVGRRQRPPSARHAPGRRDLPGVA